ncbi:hypothetical protein PMIN01_02435 [Paraphaeosphaeria minitans]|uniref:DUF7730 domain-containing protein n=1 Tax=Paraphaeosphaeria minitans TaxID=565426 RepID=A0A9P6GR10_9PLEO|nr:hypothetical protein PMIN01_02435 [Paraphaeosphaeria minitans]
MDLSPITVWTDINWPEEKPVIGLISIVGTVKLHGTHADILISSDNTIALQSRNNAVLLETADNLGFAKSMSTKRPDILRLRDQFLLGSGSARRSKKVSFSRRLVIISAKINGSWVADVDYADIEAPEDDIYNISRGGTYRSMLYPEEPQRTIDELEPPANTIAAQSFCSNFKIKGGRFKPTFTPTPKSRQWTKQRSERLRAQCKSSDVLPSCVLVAVTVMRKLSALLPAMRWIPHDIEPPSSSKKEKDRPKRSILSWKPTEPNHGALKRRKSVVSLTSEADEELDARTHMQGQSAFFAMLPIEIRKMVYEYTEAAPHLYAPHTFSFLHITHLLYLPSHVPQPRLDTIRILRLKWTIRGMPYFRRNPSSKRPAYPEDTANWEKGWDILASMKRLRDLRVSIVDPSPEGIWEGHWLGVEGILIEAMKRVRIPRNYEVMLPYASCRVDWDVGGCNAKLLRPSLEEEAG